MRKLKLQVQITVNGFVAKPGGELNWMTWNWSDDIKAYVTELTILWIQLFLVEN